MKKNFQKERMKERGNAFIYVLIAIGLFAALSFTLSRNVDTGEAGAISDEKAELYAVQILNYSANVKSAVEKMRFSGIDIDDLSYVLPGEVSADREIFRVYGPSGGGLIPAELPESAKNEIAGNPAPGYYLGMFNTVEWTESTDQDILFSAFEIAPEVCARINLQVTGNPTIPTMAAGANPRALFVDTGFHGVANQDLTIARCAGCEGYDALCVQNDSATPTYAFYTIIEGR